MVWLMYVSVDWGTQERTGRSACLAAYVTHLFPVDRATIVEPRSALMFITTSKDSEVCQMTWHYADVAPMNFDGTTQAK